MMAKKTKYTPMLQGKERRKYTVWVGGTEVTENFIEYTKAKEILNNYLNQGYTDVIIQEGR